MCGYLLLSAGQSGVAWIVTFIVAATMYAVLGGARGGLQSPIEKETAEGRGTVSVEPGHA
jgi:hypothetical protein